MGRLVLGQKRRYWVKNADGQKRRFSKAPTTKTPFCKNSIFSISVVAFDFGLCVNYVFNNMIAVEMFIHLVLITHL